jgi:hypothetical protein
MSAQTASSPAAPRHSIAATQTPSQLAGGAAQRRPVRLVDADGADHDLPVPGDDLHVAQGAGRHLLLSPAAAAPGAVDRRHARPGRAGAALQHPGQRRNAGDGAGAEQHPHRHLRGPQQPGSDLRTPRARCQAHRRLYGSADVDRERRGAGSVGRGGRRPGDPHDPDGAHRLWPLRRPAGRQRGSPGQRAPQRTGDAPDLAPGELPGSAPAQWPGPQPHQHHARDDLRRAGPVESHRCSAAMPLPGCAFPAATCSSSSTWAR